MWRKLHSNRDPNYTVWSELRKEFAGHFRKADNGFQSVANKYPKYLFGLMVAALVASFILSFTRFRHPATPVAVKTIKVSPLRDGIGQIIDATEKIRESIRLKHLIDSVSAKKSLTGADSVLLDSALTRFEKLRSMP
jgi:hypothetical protein